MVAPGRPTIVVPDGTLSLMYFVCAAAEAARASSIGPDGSVSRPHTAGSYAAR